MHDIQANPPLSSGKNKGAKKGVSQRIAPFVPKGIVLACNLAATAGVFYFCDNSFPSVKDQPYLVIGQVAFFFATLVLAGIFDAHPIESSAEKLGIAIRLILEVFIAAIGATLLAQSGVLGASDAQSWAIGFFVGLTLLATQGAAHASGIVDSLTAWSHRAQDTARKVEAAAESLVNIKEHQRVTGMLMDYLDLGRRSTVLENDTARQALNSAVEATRSWFATGDNLGTRGDIAVKDASWWRIMATYYREERYDIARNEIVTNVRNYAFVILSLIREQIEATKSESVVGTGGGEGLRVVVAQVSPFAPKDFYNFPNGVSSNRRYFDQEFFGTYRRLLSLYLGHPKVDVRRVVLCAGPSADGGQRDLGWQLDDPVKLFVGCRYMNVLPLAVAVSYGDDTIASKLLVDRVWKRGGDPRGHGRPRRETLPWVPVYSDGRWLHLKSVEQPYKQTLEILAKRLQDQDESYSHVTIQNGKLVRCFPPSTPNNEGDSLKWLCKQPEANADKAWTSLVDEVEARSKALKVRDDNRSVRVAQQIDGGMEVLKSKRNLVYEAFNVGGSPKVDNSFEDLFDLVTKVQEIDALLANCSMQKRTQGPRVIGYAEEWLYWWLAQLEWKRYFGGCDGLNCAGDKQLPTVWDRFKRDFLQHATGDSKDSLKERLRIVPVSHSSTERGDELSTNHFESEGLLPEFLLIGVKAERESISWRVFLGAEMSDPFYAARIRFEFSRGEGEFPDGKGEKRGPSLLAAHSAWLDSVWGKGSGEARSGILKDLADAFVEAVEISTEDGGMDATMAALQKIADVTGRLSTGAQSSASAANGQVAAENVRSRA